MSIKIVALLVGLIFASVHAEAQQLKKIPRVGFLAGASGEPNLRGLRQGLRELGYVEGKNIIIEYRVSEGEFDRFHALAAELVRLKVDVIVTQGTPAAAAAKNATSTIPIIMSGGTDPVATGLVLSLARPGGNITGVTIMNEELAGKRLELLKETSPKVSPSRGSMELSESGYRRCFQTDTGGSSRATSITSIPRGKKRKQFTGCV